MKKWMAMALALCMLCGMVNAATAEEYQTVSTAYLDFDVPANAEYEIHDHGGNVSIFVSYDQWEMTIRFNTRASGSEYQQEAFDESSGGYYVANYGWIPLKDAHWGLADGGVVKSCHTVEGSPDFGETNIYTHAFDWGFMELGIYSWDNSGAIDEADLIDVVKPIFRSVRMPGEPSPVKPANVKPANVKQENMKPDVAPVGKQPLTIGRASFEVDADLEIVQVDGYRWMLTNDQYAVIFYYFEYGEDDIDSFTDGDIQIDNCFFINYMATDDQQTALNVCNLAQRTDIGMPGGDDVLHLSLGGVVMLSHYYPNMGFMMMGQCKDGSLSDEKILAMLEEIALSFRVDGMTADEMGAHKAQAEADLAVAIAAQEEAERLAQEEAARKAAEEATRKRVYITASGGCNIRSGPDTSYAKISYGYNGDSFPYLGTEGNWHKIEVNGQTGYVSKGMCEVR